MIYYTIIDSPFDPLLLTSDGTSLTGLHMGAQKHAPTLAPHWQRNDDALPFAEAKQQLAAYFAGKLHEFDLPLKLEGSDFQIRVWQTLLQIPYGRTWSYGELASKIDNPKASRAVGLANGRNPIGIIVPCHRVIGASGKLTGYGGGLPRKIALLALEGGQLL